jgi:cytosine/adenosine deaminase-related metal-dependent hydrolase
MLDQKVVCPGFVDVNGHSDWTLFANPSSPPAFWGGRHLKTSFNAWATMSETPWTPARIPAPDRVGC